ncbi:hypothetical protein HDV05_003746 [Chytridiales sp. JEL 0842]|nr:hypothetical protein HDV05_003746 [Chytridiales sp. JEL 0842]
MPSTPVTFTFSLDDETEDDVDGISFGAKTSLSSLTTASYLESRAASNGANVKVQTTTTTTTSSTTSVGTGDLLAPPALTSTTTTTTTTALTDTRTSSTTTWPLNDSFNYAPLKRSMSMTAAQSLVNSRLSHILYHNLAHHPSHQSHQYSNSKLNQVIHHSIHAHQHQQHRPKKKTNSTVQNQQLATSFEPAPPPTSLDYVKSFFFSKPKTAPIKTSKAITNSNKIQPPLSIKPKRTANSENLKEPQPVTINIRYSLCGQFMVAAEKFWVPLTDGGMIPMDRRTTLVVYNKATSAKGAVLLVPGFASNRSVFDMGGGVGRSGPSFFEYLAKCGYDTYAIDLRGSRQSMALGSKSPAFIKEHVEIDVPCAINFIKKFGHSKVYLIGHSMGGAISCASAGFNPENIAGIVHLAGLYHYSVPYLRDVTDIYKSYCPQTIQSVVSKSASFAVRSTIRLLAPAVNTVSTLLGGGQQQPSKSNVQPPPSTPTGKSSPSSPAPSQPEYSALENLISNEGRVVPHSSTTVSTALSLLTHLRRQHIPVRSVIDTLLFLKKFVPGPIERSLMECMYPSPWIPYSVEDPWAFVDESCESPSLGIWWGIGTMALREEVYYEWLMQNEGQKQRGEDEKVKEEEAVGGSGFLGASKSARKKVAKGGLSADMKEWEGGKDTFAKKVMKEAVVDPPVVGSRVAKAAESESVLAGRKDSFFDKADDEAAHGGQGAAEELDSEQAELLHNKFLREMLAHAILNSGASPYAQQAEPEQFAEKTESPAETKPAPILTEPQIQPNPFDYSSSSSSTPPKPAPRKKKAAPPPPRASWNELAPYLTKFEQLEHLPLFFCPANADKVLRNEDSIAGYKRSGSKWKDVIEYMDDSKKKNGMKKSPSSSSESSLGGSGSTQSEKCESKQGEKVEGGKKRLIPASLMITPIVDKSVGPLNSAGGASLGGKSPTVDRQVDVDAEIEISPPVSTSEEEEEQQQQQEEALPPPPPPPPQPPRRKKRSKSHDPLKPRYAVPESYSYGHCDILGGKHAEQVWARIAEWLDATTAREEMMMNGSDASTNAPAAATTTRSPDDAQARIDATQTSISEVIHHDDHNDRQINRVIVVAADPSEHAEYAMTWALDNFINPAHDLLVLINVRPYVSTPGPYGALYMDFSEFIVSAEEAAREEAHILLQDLARIAKRKHSGLAIKAIAIRGDARDEIVRKINELEADALIMGSRGLGPISRTLLGSISDYCVHNVTSCPVIIVKQDESKLAKNNTTQDSTTSVDKVAKKINRTMKSSDSLVGGAGHPPQVPLGQGASALGTAR